MTLEINDTILYGVAGVCTVIGRTYKEFFGENTEYYVLKPVHQENSTIYAPVNNEKAKEKMRPVLSEAEIHTILKKIITEDAIHVPEDAQAKDVYRQILENGNRLDILRMIRTLSSQEKEKKSEGKKLHAADERYMKKAEKILYEEFAHVLQINPDQVLTFIKKQIEAEE